MLSVAEAPLVALAPLVEALEAPAAMLEDWFAEAEAEGWLVEEAGWLADAEAAGWFAEADFSLSELDWPAAIAEPAAINAAARASFLNCMVDVLSYGQLTAVRFGAKAAHKLQAAAAPSDARHLRRIHGGTAT